MPYKLLLIVDLETTGLIPENSKVMELGAILYSVQNACVIQQLSTLFPVSENPAQKINKINVQATQMVDDYSISLEQFRHWVDIADFMVAHNAEFDKQWFGFGLLPEINKPWLCTYDDFVWSKNEKPTSLINTVLNYGIGVNNAHRALTDCQLIAALFDRVSESGEFEEILTEAIERSKEPKKTVIAKVSYDDRNLAKQFRFKWNPDKKAWLKEIRLSDLTKEQVHYPFQITLQ